MIVLNLKHNTLNIIDAVEYHKWWRKNFLMYEQAHKVKMNMSSIEELYKILYDFIRFKI